MNSESGAPAASNRFTLGLLALGHLVNDWVAGAIWIIAPAIAASMGLGPSEVGLILAVNGVAAGLAYVPAGIIADRQSNQGLLMTLTFWWVAIGYFCASLAPGFWAVTLLLAVGVMGDAFWHPVATGVLVKRMPAQRAQVLGIHAVGGSIGAEMLGPVSAGLLLGLMDWRASLQVLVVPAVVTGILFMVVIRRFDFQVRPKASAMEFRSLIRSWATPRGLTMMSMMIFYNMALFGMLAMTPLVLQNNYGVSPLHSGILFAAMLVLGTLMQPFTGKLSDRSGRRVLILAYVGAATVFVLVAGMVTDFAAFTVSLLLSASLLTAIRPVILAAAVEFSSQSESTTLGLVFAILDGVGALGALAAGFAGEFDLQYAYLLSGILALASVLTGLLIDFRSADRARP